MKLQLKKISFPGVELPLTSIFNFIHLSSIQVSNALLALLLFPVIIRITGLESFGHVMVANSFAALIGIGINYGTNQSGIMDIALHKNDPKALSEKFYRIFGARLILFAVSLLIIPCLQALGIANFHYYVFAYTLIFAEVVNPLFFFIGIEKLLAFNIGNLISKALSILLIIFLVKGSDDVHMVNFYLGLSNLLVYVPLAFYAIWRYQMKFIMPGIVSLLGFIRINFSLFINNVSVQLQQSIFVFAISSTGNPLVLGAYTLCDKILWAFRLLIISFSNAIYPRCILLFHEDASRWTGYKNRINKALTLVFLLQALVFLVAPSLVVNIFTGKTNELSNAYLRATALVPLVMALNAMNVLELLIKNATKVIFNIAVCIVAFSAIISFLFIRINEPNWFAFYPLCIETACLILYRLYLSKDAYRTPGNIPTRI